MAIVPLEAFTSNGVRARTPNAMGERPGPGHLNQEADNNVQNTMQQESEVAVPRSRHGRHKKD